MKKLLFIVSTILLFFVSSPVKALDVPEDVTADAIFLLNLDEDEVVLSKNPDKAEIMASLTKIMTAYTVIQNIDDLNKKVTITEEDLYALWGFTVAGLEVDDQVSYLDLLYAMMLVSGADAAQALALHTSGSKEAFNDLMNKEAQKLGLRHSHFADAYGGDDANVSTAREMARLLKTALQNETFKKIFGTNYYTLSNGLKVVNYTASSATFHGLDSYLLTGNKSGYTPEAGLLLASTATINKINYILIVCKSEENTWKTTHILDTYKIYDYISNIEFNHETVLKKGTFLKKIPVENGTTSEYNVFAEKDMTAYLTPEDYAKVKYDIHIVDKLTPENKMGDIIGYVDLIIDDNVIATYNVYLRDEIFSIPHRSRIVIIFIIALIFIVLIILSVNLFFIPKKR